MRKFSILAIIALVMNASPAFAAITVDTVPGSLVTNNQTLTASTPKAVFEFALTANAGETLSSVAVTVNSTTAAVPGDFEKVSVYKNNTGTDFDSGDFEVGSNTTVNIGSTITINTGTTSIATDKFFVVVKTSSTWAHPDSFTVTFNANGITTSANSPTNSSVTTSTLSALDETGPVLTSVVANNKSGSTIGMEEGDYVVFTFGEATTKAVVSSANIAGAFLLNNEHTWLNGVSSIYSYSWNDAGTILTVTLSGGTTLPTVTVGDTVTMSGSLIEDATGNAATGTQTITGCFDTCQSNGDGDDNDEYGKVCASGIKNGKLYRIEGSQTVYLAAACKLKPFRGAAVFHARGHKFQNIITLSSLNGITVSDKPALPAGGTLVKGSKKTVWFVTESGTLMGFVSEKAFKRLGFNFGSVKEISDSDLAEMLTGSNIGEDSSYPEGAVVKCTQSSTVYMMKGNKKYAFTNPTPYLERGHTWDAIAVMDCTQTNIPTGGNITE
jgi:hypothetical protein